MDDKFPIDNEEQFFHNLFVEYYPSLCSFALRYVGDGEVVEDLGFLQKITGLRHTVCLCLLMYVIRWAI